MKDYGQEIYVAKLCAHNFVNQDNWKKISAPAWRKI